MKKILFTILTILLLQLVGKSQTIKEEQKIVASDRFDNDRFGYSVSISGNYAVVGADYEDEDENGNNTISAGPGSAYIYERDINGNWVEVQKIVASDRLAFDGFGKSVTISGDNIAIGSYNKDGNRGAVYIFQRSISGVWSETQKLVAPVRRSPGFFGNSVSMDNDYLIVGEERDGYDENEMNQLYQSGSAFIYELDGSGTWNLANKIVSSDRAAEDYFGICVSITKEGYAVVGAYWVDTDESGLNPISKAGAAYVFERNVSGNWLQVDKLVADNRAATTWWGGSIAIDSNFIAVGAQEEQGGKGSVSVFERSVGGSWNFSQKVLSSDIRSGDRFGTSISLSSGNLLVGAPTSGRDLLGNNNILAAGAAYLFNQNQSGSWIQTQKILASDRGTTDDRFGHSVSMSGNFSILSAYKDDHNVVGGNYSPDAGSAYIFNTCFTMSNVFENACDSYTSPSGNSVWTTSGIYYDTIQNANGCDSIMTINLTINPAYSSSEAVSICSGSDFTFPDGSTQTNITSQVVHSSNLQTINNCDSIIETTVEVYPSYILTENDTVCSGTSYTFPDGSIQNNITSEVLYTSHLQTVNGCDSIIESTISIAPGSYELRFEEICPGGSFTFPDGTMQSNITSQITYSSLLQSVKGCDSVIEIVLSMAPTYFSIENITICSGSSYVFPDGSTQNNITNDVVYTSHLQTVLGCDSIIETEVIVNLSYSSLESIFICSGGSYTFPDGSIQNNITNDVVYTSNLQTLQGCDSIIETTIVVNNIDTSVSVLNETLTANLSGAQYQWIDCSDNSYINGAIMPSYTASENGDYAVEITDNGCVDTSSCFSVNSTGLDNIKESQILLYPNPIIDILNIQFKSPKERIITISNYSGKVISKEFTSKMLIKLNMFDYVKGVYFISVEEDVSIKNYKIIK